MIKSFGQILWVCLLCPVIGFAAPNVWEGQPDVIDNWSDPSLWSLGTVPDGSTEIVIPHGGVRSDVSFTNQLGLDISNDGELFLQPATTITNHGDLLLNGSIRGGGTILSGSHGVIRTDVQGIIGVNVTQAPLVGIMDAGTLGLLTFDGITVTGGVFQQGKLEALNGAAVRDLQFGLDPMSTVSLRSDLTLLGTETVVGTLDLGGARLSGPGELAIGGRGVIDGGIIGVNVTQSPSGVIEGRSGTLTLDGITVTGGIIGQGVFDSLNGATVRDVQFGSDRTSTVSLQSGADLALLGTDTVVGTLDLLGSDARLSGSGQLVVGDHGVIEADGGRGIIGVNVTQGPNGVVRANQGGTIVLDGITVNRGTVGFGDFETLNGAAVRDVQLDGVTLVNGSQLTLLGTDTVVSALDLQSDVHLTGAGALAVAGIGRIEADGGRAIIGVDVTQGAANMIAANQGATVVLDGNTVRGGALGFGDFEALNGATVRDVKFGISTASSVTLTAASDLTAEGSTSVIGTLTDAGILRNLGALANGNVMQVVAGGTLVNAGSLGVSNGGGLGVAAGGTLINSGFFSVDYLSGVAFAAGSQIENTGTMTLASNSVVLNGTMVDDGSMVLAAGPITGDPPLARPAPPLDVTPTGRLSGIGSVLGNVQNDGTMSPGDAVGSFTVDGNYSQSQTGALDIFMDGAGLGQFGVLDIAELASLGGTLDFIANNGFAPQIGDQFQFLLFGASLGDFVSVLFTNWTCPVDAFCNQIRTDRSLTLAILGTGTTTTVPEPDTLSLVGLGLLCLFVVRRRRTSP